MLCQACNQNPATVRVIEITHPPKSAAAPKSKTAADPKAAGAAESSASMGAEAGAAGATFASPSAPTAGVSGPDACSQPAAPSTAHEQWLCEACAQTQSIHFGQAKDISEVWKLLKAQQPSGRKPAPGVACPECGMTMRDFRQRGRLGCPKDYEIFGAQLRDLLERIHGAARHVGRGPNQDEGVLLRRKRIDELQQALASAIRDEAYEQAAKLRDEIQSLEHS